MVVVVWLQDFLDLSCCGIIRSVFLLIGLLSELERLERGRIGEGRVLRTFFNGLESMLRDDIDFIECIFAMFLHVLDRKSSMYISTQIPIPKIQFVVIIKIQITKYRNNRREEDSGKEKRGFTTFPCYGILLATHQATIQQRNEKRQLGILVVSKLFFPLIGRTKRLGRKR